MYCWNVFKMGAQFKKLIICDKLIVGCFFLENSQIYSKYFILQSQILFSETSVLINKYQKILF